MIQGHSQCPPPKFLDDTKSALGLGKVPFFTLQRYSSKNVICEVVPSQKIIISMPTKHFI